MFQDQKYSLSFQANPQIALIIKRTAQWAEVRGLRSEVRNDNGEQQNDRNGRAEIIGQRSEVRNQMPETTVNF